jgi:predicted peptidase
MITFFRNLVVFALLACAARGDGPFIESRVPDKITVPETANRRYRLLVPDDAGKAGSRFPLVIYLHGAGAKGSDNAKQLTEPLPRLFVTQGLREMLPCFVLVPQCRDGEDALGRPNNWVKWENQRRTPPAQWERAEAQPSDQLRAAMAALEHVLATQPIDRTRIFLTGVSMGGSGTWNWAAHEPERFAAIITACGLSEPEKAPALAKLPLWAFHGSDDPIAPVGRSRRMIAALRAIGSTVQFTEYTGAGHGIAERVFSENDHAVLRWLFTQRREYPQ